MSVCYVSVSGLMFDGWVMRLLFRLLWHWRTQAVEVCTEFQGSSELFAYAGAVCDSQSSVSSFPRQMLLLLRLMYSLVMRSYR